MFWYDHMPIILLGLWKYFTKLLILYTFSEILRFLLQEQLQATSHFFFFFIFLKLVSEIFAFARLPNVDGNMIMEMIPPVGGSSAPSIRNTFFEVCWSFASRRSLRWSPWRFLLSFFLPWVGHSCSIPVCFAVTGTDYLVSFELDMFLSNILDICCLTPVFILCTEHLTVAMIIGLEIYSHPR